ncbi:MAG: apolipoprotein N-acyltransferase [Pseudomonadota bacterium]
MKQHLSASIILFLKALCAGFIAHFAMPPSSFIGLIGLMGLIWLNITIAKLYAKNLKHALQKACLVGFAFGFAFFISGLHWISEAPGIYNPDFAFLGGLAVVALSAFMALYFSLACGFTIYLSSISKHFTSNSADFKLQWMRIGVLSLCMLLSEWGRSTIATGFPWHLWGHALAPYESLSQIASISGIYGASALILTLCALTSASFLILDFKHISSVLSLKKGLLFLTPLSLALTIIAGIMVWGQHRLDTTNLTSLDINIQILQPNIAQPIKWHPKHIVNNFRIHLELQKNAPAKTAFIIWPETAAAFDLGRSQTAIAAIAQHLPEHSFALVGTLSSDEHFNRYNSMLVIDHHANIQAKYDKFHLVPFGEYTPLEHILPILTGGGYQQGTGLKHFSFQAKNDHQSAYPSFSTLICYEIIFPGQVALSGKKRPDFLVNITNDAWFAKGSGPQQHLEMARWRAIEEGLMIARATNTGISAFIDPLGRIIKTLSWNERGVLNTPFIEPLEPTFYSCYGHLPLMLTALLILAIIIFNQILIRQSQQKQDHKSTKS